MNPIKIDTTNTTFVAPGCDDLPATRCIYNNGINGFETCWELTDEEIELLKSTKRLYVSMMGSAPPPMLVSVTSTLKD